MADEQAAVILYLNQQRHVLTIDNPVHGGVGMPGGKHEERDGAIVNTAVREGLEEVALLSDPADLIPIYAAHWRFKEKNGVFGPERLITLFYARAAKGTPHGVAEDTVARWLMFMELRTRSPFVSFYTAALGPHGSNLRNLAPTVFT